MTAANTNAKTAANAKAEKIFSIADIAEITGQDPKKIRRILRNAIPAENQPRNQSVNCKGCIARAGIR